MKSTDLKPNHRILIVDDNASIHTDFRDILCPANSSSAASDQLEAALFGEDQKATAIGFVLNWISAYQGQEALAMVEQSLAENRPYAMAFVDVRMPPGWDGIETIARIWKVHPELQIVVCTAYSDYSWEEMRAKVGQPDSLLVIKKPFDNVEVQQMAHALTKKWMLNVKTGLQMAELAQANKSLAISEERFSKAFHESPLPSGIQSMPDQRFVDVNQRLAAVAGLKREEMIGRTPAELFLWEKPEVADQWYDGLIKTGAGAGSGSQSPQPVRRPARDAGVLVPPGPGPTAPFVALGPGHLGASFAGASIASSPEDGGDRSVGRRCGSRFQQHSHRDPRTRRPLAV